MQESKLILCIDDELMVRHSIISYLEDFGYNLIEAESGREGIEKIKSQNPDIILCDLRMPDIDGLEVLKFVQQESLEIPVIMISGTSLMTDVVEALRLGAYDYLIKPIVDMGILNIAIEKALEKVRLVKENHEYKLHLEEMLAIRTKQLIISEREAAFSQVVQGIVHNMRTPISIPLSLKELTKISFQNIVEELSSEKIDKEKIVSNLDKIQQLLNLNHEAGLKINEMVDSLMIKSASDKIDELRVVDLNEILRREINFMEANFIFRNKLIKEINISNEKFMVKVVPSEISQVFHNLIKNAMDAMYKEDKPMLKLYSEEIDGRYKVIIEDNGPGIPETIKDKIFDPFFTTKPTEKKTSDEPIGTGLGLHFCKNTINSYQGKIEIDSEEGRGCKISILIPKNL